MASIKFLLLLVVVLIGWKFIGEVFDQLKSTGHRPSIREQLHDWGSWAHYSVGIAAIAIVLILLVRLIVLAAKCR